METTTILVILGIVFGSGVSGLLGFFAARFDRRADRKQTKLDQHVSATVGFKQVELDRAEKEFARLLQILDAKREMIDDLRKDFNVLHLKYKESVEREAEVQIQIVDIRKEQAIRVESDIKLKTQNEELKIAVKAVKEEQRRIVATYEKMLGEKDIENKNLKADSVSQGNEIEALKEIIKNHEKRLNAQSDYIEKLKLILEQNSLIANIEL